MEASSMLPRFRAMKGNPGRSHAVRFSAALMLAATAGGIAPAAWAQTLTADEVLSSISLSMVAAPNPVLGADNRIHLAYELIASNTSKLFITLDKVEAVDQDKHVLGTLAGAPLAAMVTLHGGSGTTMSPGGSAIIFMDTAFAAGASLPPAIAARLTITRQSAGPDGKPAPFPAGRPVARDNQLHRTPDADRVAPRGRDRPAAARTALGGGQWLLRHTDLASRRGDGGQRRSARAGTFRDRLGAAPA